MVHVFCLLFRALPFIFQRNILFHHHVVRRDSGAAIS
jgi:hypothetical protein